MTNGEKTKEAIRKHAEALGFYHMGVAKAEQMEPEAKRLEAWLNQGSHGKMSYMENHFEKRVDPTKLVPGARSVISLAYNYYTPNQQTVDAPKISTYAYGKDYHYIVKDKLRALFQFIQDYVGKEMTGRCFVDSAPVLERDWAKRAGTGWIGKNTMLIHPKKGSFFFLGEIILDLDLPPDAPMQDYCGTCRKCIDACPTEAIAPEGYHMDGSKCISYLTIELKEEIPQDFVGQMEGWVFGCDICQEVCPWNRFSSHHDEESFMPKDEIKTYKMEDWEAVSKEAFGHVFSKSAVKRTKFEGFMRNLSFLKKSKMILLLLCMHVIQACGPSEAPESNAHEEKIAHESNVKNFSAKNQIEIKTGIELIVLGNVQDAGSPHIGCKKSCCQDLFNQPDPARMVVSLGLVDHDQDKQYLIEATPDMPRQLVTLNNHASASPDKMPDGVFITHAHMGHYSGLMYFGREAKGADRVPVFLMPQMKKFVEENGPWSQLVDLNNILIEPLANEIPQSISPQLKVTPFKVPHRDEFSETVGFRIEGPNKSALFIPDIDKWSKWETEIETLIRDVDIAFLDATFYDGAEINHRDISEIPHPFVIESMSRFSSLPREEKQKIHFIHLNHTNPLLDIDSDAFQQVVNNGFKVAQFGQTFTM